MRAMGYDSRCYDLAEVFLDGEEADEATKARLAQAIQDAIEDWLADRRRHPPGAALAGDGGEEDG